MKRAVLRPMAMQDLIAAKRWYAERGGDALGARAFDAARRALKPIERMPSLGSPRVGERCGIPGLRHWGVDGFPIRWFNFERDDSIDVVHLLGDRQDIAAILSPEPAEPAEPD